MKVPRYFRFSRHEQVALAVSISLLATGIALSRFCGPGWLAGFGALISIAGVVLALYDLAPILDARAKRLASLRANLTLNALVESIEDDSRLPISDDDFATAKAVIDREVRPGFEASAQLPKRRYLAVGAFIICLGTFVNGFSSLIDAFIQR